METANEKVATVNILGVRVSAINLGTALAAIEKALTLRRKGYVCVTGVHGIIEAQDDPDFREILNQAFLCTPDGMPLTWVGRYYGHRVMDRVYGPDLMLLVLERSRQTGWRHFFYGGGTGLADELKLKLNKRFPEVTIAGTFTPPFRPLDQAEETELTEAVTKARPDIIWVGLSTPKQEKFMADYLPKLDSTLMIGVGAAFDFHAGRVRQAPRWIQRGGLEWLYRLCSEPRRLWRRYLWNNPRFIWKIFRQVTGLS